MTFPRSIAYRRVSTDEQALSGLGLEAQAATINQAITARGWSEPVATFTDAGVSGKTAPEAREALSQALAMLDAGEADVLVVAKLDRLTRSVGTLAALLDRADRARWSLVILDADVDTTTAGGRLVANVLGSVSEWERMVIGERTKAALAQRRAEGVRLGRPVELPDDTRQLVKALSDEGLSLRAIATRLTDQGVKTAKGGKWHASTVKATLASLELDQASA